MAKKVDMDCVEQIYHDIEQKYGSGVMVDGDTVRNERRHVISMGPSLDIVTSGGIQEGCWVGITGNPKTGKSSCCLSFAANCQRPENGSRPVFYAKVEGRLSQALLDGTRGLQKGKPHFNLIQSSSGLILTAQQYLEILLQILRSVPRAVVIIDSISALCDEREMNDGIGTETRGAGAKLFSQFCRTAANVVPTQKAIVMGITHLISNTSGKGAPFVERVARGWQYQCDYQLRVRQRSDWETGGRQIGYVVKWECGVTPIGRPGMTMDSYVRFGVGIDRLFELIQLGLGIGLVHKSGSWLSLPGREGKYQGAERLYQHLLDQPKVADELENEIKKSSYGLNGSFMEPAQAGVPADAG